MFRLYALLGILWFIIAVALLHILEPALAPTTSTVSEYVLGPYGWLMRTAFFALALGSAALAARLRSARSLGSATRLLLWVWVTGVAIAGIFPTDPGGAASSWHAIIHGIAASVSLLSLYLAELSSLRSRKLAPRTLTTVTGIVCVFIPAVVVLGVIGLLPFGLIERCILAAHMAWLLGVVAWAAPATDKPALSAPLAPQ